MKLRFAVLLGACLAAPLWQASAEALPNRTYRFGLMVERAAGSSDPYVAAFIERLRELGYEEGRNLTIDYRFNGYEAVQARKNAEELAKLPLDLVVVGGNQQPYLVKDSLGSLPLIVASCDPVDRLTESLVRPGGLITGTACMSAELSPKKLEILSLLVPNARRIAALYGSSLPGPELAVKLMSTAAPSLGIELQAVPVDPTTRFSEISHALDVMHPDALIIYPEQTVGRHFSDLQEYVTTHRLPALYGFREAVDAGGLISYGSNLRDLMRRAASLADRVANGTPPGNLPIELPTRIELIVNRKAARAINLEIPASILIRADEVIN